MTSHQNDKTVSATDDLDPDSMAAIRNLLAEAEPAPAGPSRRERKAARAAKAAAVDSPVPRVEQGAAQDTVPEPQQPASKATVRPKGPGIVQRLKERVMRIRPTPRLVVLGLLALLVLFRPWLVVGLLMLFAFILTAVFLILGYDGFWRRVMGVARWYARRHPSRSVELHRKLDAFAMKFDAFLDRFPEGSVDGLYLPDFGDLAAADARHQEALDRRFDRLRETGA